MDRRTLGQTSAQATPRTEQRSSLLRRFASRPLLFAVALLFGTTFTPVIRPAGGTARARRVPQQAGDGD